MATPKMPFVTQLFINGVRIGDAYQDWYGSEAEALSDTRAFFEEKEEGATVDIEVADLPRWPGTEPVRTFVVRITRAEVGQ